MDISKESHDVEQAPVTSVLQDGDFPIKGQVMSEDERVITSLGYKQEFKREFSLWTTFCVSFAVLGLLPSFASTVYYGISAVTQWPKDANRCRNGLRRYGRHGLGLAHSDVLHPMCRHGNGRAVLRHAD